MTTTLFADMSTIYLIFFFGGGMGTPLFWPCASELGFSFYIIHRPSLHIHLCALARRLTHIHTYKWLHLSKASVHQMHVLESTAYNTHSYYSLVHTHTGTHAHRNAYTHTHTETHAHHMYTHVYSFPPYNLQCICHITLFIKLYSVY